MYFKSSQSALPNSSQVSWSSSFTPARNGERSSCVETAEDMTVKKIKMQRMKSEPIPRSHNDWLVKIDKLLALVSPLQKNNGQSPVFSQANFVTFISIFI